MTAAELLKALEGVPDEALPEDFRLRLRDCDHMAPMDDDRHAAVGAMVAWLAKRYYVRCGGDEGGHLILSSEPHGHFAGRQGYSDKGNYIGESGFKHKALPTLLAALASACRAVAQLGSVPQGE